MGQFPSFWQLAPSEGLQPVPLQQRVLDFTPLIASMKGIQPTTSTSKNADKEEPKYRDMRKGYAEQLFARGRTIQEKMRVMESIYGEDVYGMPAYQQMERDESDNFSYENMMYGSQEKDLIDTFGANIKDKGHYYILEEMLKGRGLRQGQEWYNRWLNTESKTIDPRSRSAEWSEDLTFNPVLFNEEDGDDYLDKLFSPAAAAWFKSGDAKIIGDYAAASAKGTLTEHYSSGNNFTQLNDAQADALRLAGLGIDEKGNIKSDELKGVFDITTPLVGGYLQGFLQGGQRRGDGIYKGDAKIADIGDKGGLTNEGATMFSEYVVGRINSHMTKRKESEYDKTNSFYEHSPNAYGAGAVADALNDLSAVTDYYDTETVQDKGYYTFDAMFNEAMTEQDKESWVSQGLMTKDSAGNYTINEKGKVEMDKWQEAFNTDYAQDVVIDKDNVVPAMYIRKVDEQGKSYYEPNEEYFADYNNNNAKLYEKYKAEEELYTELGETGKVKNVRDRKNMLVKMMQGGQSRMINSSQTVVSEGRLGAAYRVKDGGTNPIDENVDKWLLGERKDGNFKNASQFPGRAAKVMGSWVDVSGLGSGVMFYDASGYDIMPGPGLSNWGAVRATDKNIQMATMANPNAEVTSDGKAVYVNGKKWLTSVNLQGDPDNPSYTGDAGNGYALPNAGQEEKSYRNNQSEGMAMTGNMQAYQHSYGRVTRGVIAGISASNLDQLSNITVDKPTNLKYPKDKALQAGNIAASAIVETTDQQKALGIHAVSPGFGYSNVAKRQFITVDESKLPKNVTIHDINRELKDMGIYGNATKEQLQIAIGQASLVNSNVPSGGVIKTFTKGRVTNKLSGNTLADLDSNFVKSHMFAPTTNEQKVSMYKGADYIFRMPVDVSDGYADVTTRAKNTLESYGNVMGDMWNYVRSVNAGDLTGKDKVYTQNRPTSSAKYNDGGIVKKSGIDDMLSSFRFTSY